MKEQNNITNNILNNTKTYLCGAMQYANGRGWRERATKELSKMGIVSYDPYNKPFVIEVDEAEDTHKKIEALIEEKNYDEISKMFKQIRSFDLALVDKSDFLIAYINPEVLTVGSWEEIFWANRLKKPIFLIMEGGKEQCPYWIFGCLPHKYIYSNLEEVIEVLKRIDSGEKDIDNDRWRLLREEFR